MSKPIYQLFVINNNIAANLAWKALSEADRKALEEQEKASRDAAGVKTILMCDSSWADEAHPAWGILQFPSLEARIEHTRRLQKMGWLDIVDGFTLLGTSDAEPAPVTIPNPIFKLWIIKSSPAGFANGALPKGLEAQMWDKHNALYKECGSQIILSCESWWCNEAYPYFGLSAYPDIEANTKIQAGLNDLGWPTMLDGNSYLGIPFA